MLSFINSNNTSFAHKKSAKQKKIILFFIAFATLALLGLTLLLHNHTQEKQREFSYRVHLITSILQELGYNGFIHNYKNYILRSDGQYLIKAEKDANLFFEMTEEYRNTNLSNDEMQSLNRLLSTVEEYYLNLDIVKNNIERGNLTTKELDSITKVDDKEAELAIAHLTQQLIRSEDEYEEASRYTLLMLLFIITFFALLEGALYFFEISAYEKAAEKLSIANEELTQFSYRASHDLKAPLTTIKGLAACVLEDIEEKNYQEVKINTESIFVQAQRLEQLVQDILELAKLDLAEPKIEKIDFKTILHELKESYVHMLKINEVEFQTHLEIKRDHYASRTRMYQILSNIVSNGIKYCDKKKTKRFVHAKITEDANNLFLNIKDNGIGIPINNKEDLFKMFTKFHSDKSLGSGLGMNIVKKAVFAMKGSIDFETSSEGTEFKLKLKTRQQA